MAVFHFVKLIFKKLIVVILTILAYIGFIILLPILTPIYLFRYFVKFCAKCFRPDLKILTTRSTMFAVDDLYNKPSAPLIIEIILKTPTINLQQGCDFVTERLINAKAKNGDRVRPELTQRICQWMGFYFWKEEDNFNIQDHVHFYNGVYEAEAYDEAALYKIEKELVSKPFRKDRSPWEFYLMNNCKKDLNDPDEEFTSLLFIHVHHCLADGFSILSLTTALISSEGSLEPMKPLPLPEISLLKKILYICLLPIYAPFEAIDTVIESYDSNEWHIPEKKLSGVVHGAMMDKVPIDYIKEIKNLHGVSFTAVIMAAFAGGIRRFMLKQGVKVPKNIHGLAPLPMPGHSGKLRNYMTACFVTLPVGMDEPVQRLRSIHKNLLKLRKSTVPVFAFHLIPFIGGLFPFMTKILARQYLVTAITSNFPGPQHEVFYLGIPILDIMFSGGLMLGNIGIGITSISYNGQIRLAAGIDGSIVPEDVPIRTLVDYIAQELDILKKEGSV